MISKWENYKILTNGSKTYTFSRWTERGNDSTRVHNLVNIAIVEDGELVGGELLKESDATRRINSLADMGYEVA